MLVVKLLQNSRKVTVCFLIMHVHELNTGSLSELLKLIEIVAVKKRKKPFDNDQYWHMRMS